MISKYPVILPSTGEKVETVIKEKNPYDPYDEKCIRVYIYKTTVTKFLWFINRTNKEKVHYCKFDPEEWKYDYVDMVKRTIENYEEELSTTRQLEDTKKNNLIKLQEWNGEL